ncbi:MAG: helix-turn-helix domain-containing protein [Burkholderiales bacterium]|nr:helix-turn-helix domain-containing protein [Burkholderiales bacterium]
MLPETALTAHEPSAGLDAASAGGTATESVDVDSHAQAQSGWSLEYDQLTAGAFKGRFECLQLPGVRLVREWCNRGVRQRGSLDPDSYGFALAAKPTQEFRFHGRASQGDSLMAGCSDELDMLCPPDFGLIAMVADAPLVDVMWQHTHGSQVPAWLRGQVVTRLPVAQATRLRDLYSRIFNDVDKPPARLDDPDRAVYLRDSVLACWLAGMPADPAGDTPPTLALRRRLVERACEIALAESEDPLSILELCRRVGASRRKLSYCFQEVLGMSPVGYLRAIRLNRVRRDLAHVGGRPKSVGNAAARWGFWHLSQFSLDYKRQFGELPSATLRRSLTA